MVAMMSLKSKAVMVPLLLLSFCANAWRACSSCSSCSTHTQTHKVQKKYNNISVKQMWKSWDMTALDRLFFLLFFKIAVVSPETNENHVPGSLIPHSSWAVGEAAGRCVRNKMIQYDNRAIRRGCRGRLTPGQCLLSKLIAYNQRTVEELQHRGASSSSYSCSDNLISGFILTMFAD